MLDADQLTEDAVDAVESAIEEPLDARPQPALVVVSITPRDASVYLDGRFLGLASELPGRLLIEPGDHRLEIVRPGFADRQLDLRVEAGEETAFDARLEPVAQGLP